MAVKCEIDFDNNPHGTYFAGQVLTGKVTLTLDKVKQVKGVALNINGFAHTSWTESSGLGKDKKSTNYSGHEDYIASQTFLLGSSASSAQVSIDPGIHVYSFTCQIPATCPSSFEGSSGHVRYLVSVVLLRPWKFDQSYTRCFTVLKVMDLNYDSPLLRVTAQVETQKVYCCWPCSSEPLSLQLSLPQTGFVPGQTIPVSVFVSNDSHIRVEELKLTLTMLVCYSTQQPSVNTTNQRLVVNKLKGDAVLSHCRKQFNYDLHVPATPPTCFNLCSIIKIAYQVELEAKVKGFHKNEVVSLPITIGTVPLSQHIQMQPPMSMQTLNVQQFQAGYSATAPTAASKDPAQPWAVDDTIPPPNYEQAVHMQASAPPMSTNQTKGSSPPNTLELQQSSFTPLYPVFNIPSPTAPVDLSQSNAGYGAADHNANKSTWL